MQKEFLDSKVERFQYGWAFYRFREKYEGEKYGDYGQFLGLSIIFPSHTFYIQWARLRARPPPKSSQCPNFLNPIVSRSILFSLHTSPWARGGTVKNDHNPRKSSNNISDVNHVKNPNPVWADSQSRGLHYFSSPNPGCWLVYWSARVQPGTFGGCPAFTRPLLEAFHIRGGLNPFCVKLMA